MTLPTFAELFARFPWRPIAGCPGRYRLPLGAAPPTVAALLGVPCDVPPRRLRQARDPVVVVPLEGGGLISYLRPDGRVVHTLGDSAGFARKLLALDAAT